MRILPVALSAAVLVGLAVAAPAAPAAAAPGSFAVSPKSPVTTGTAMTVYDDNSDCTDNVAVTIGGGPGADTHGDGTTDVQGGWTVQLPAPDVVGSYTIHVVCETKSKGVPPTFTDETLDVVALPVLSIDPSSGPAGTIIDVSGTECSYSGVSISLVSDPDGAATVLDSQVLSPETTDWTGTLTVPMDAIATADGGNYVVEATCGGSVEFSFDYDALPFVVTAPVVTTTTTVTPTTAPPAVQATPVAAAAAFTG